MIEAIGAMGVMTFLYLGFLWLGSALFCAGLADAKNRSGLLWFVAGFLFGIVALIAIAGMPAGGTRTCPYCLQSVHKNTRVCGHCTRDVVPA